MFSTVGAALGPLLGGLIASKTTWRWIFYINIPIGGGMFVPTSKHTHALSIAF